MSEIAVFTKAFLADPNSWKLFVPAGFVHPKTENPNYVPPNRGPLMTGFTILNVVLAFLLVGPRLYSRLFVVRSFRLDDWLIIPAFICHIASTIVIMYAVKDAGLGKHVYDCTSEEILAWYRVQYCSNITMLTTIFITRASILCFVKSLAGPAEKKSRLIVTCVQVANCLVWPGTMLPAILMCAPEHEFRNWSLPVLAMSQCIRPITAVNIQKVALAMGVSGVVLDFAILIIPIRIVWKLRLPIRQRVIVSGLFAIGSLACIASICKAVYISVQLSNNATFDLSWTFVDIFVAAEFEQTLALVTACGPGLKPLFSRAFPMIRDTLRGASRSKSSSGNSGLPAYSREGKAGLVTIGSSGKKNGMSEADSAASIVGNSEGGLWRGDLESGHGVEGVPSVWQGEAEPSTVWPSSEVGGQEMVWRGDLGVQNFEQIPKVWRGDLDHASREQASVAPVWQGELGYTRGEDHQAWQGGSAI